MDHDLSCNVHNWTQPEMFSVTGSCTLVGQQRLSDAHNYPFTHTAPVTIGWCLLLVLISHGDDCCCCLLDIDGCCCCCWSTNHYSSWLTIPNHSLVVDFHTRTGGSCQHPTPPPVGIWWTRFPSWPRAIHGHGCPQHTHQTDAYLLRQTSATSAYNMVLAGCLVWILVSWLKASNKIIFTTAYNHHSNHWCTLILGY